MTMHEPRTRKLLNSLYAKIYATQLLAMTIASLSESPSRLRAALLAQKDIQVTTFTYSDRTEQDIQPVLDEIQRILDALPPDE